MYSTSFRTYNVILMFSTFDVLLESSLHDKAEKEFITVGWGKKETQFHGSVGKNARKNQDIEQPNVEELDKTITCCWRGDGEYFAVNHVGNNGRMFKVFNKEGVIQYTSELCADLQVPIAWKPSGLWICKPQIHPNKYTITLFERNGLKHQELILPFKPEVEKVVKLSWSQNSDIFLIETVKENDMRCLYFYTISNYHWYLKQYLEFETSIIYEWSQNFAEPKQLYLFSSDGRFFIYKFDFSISCSSGISENDESIVAVLDGQKILLTNFKSQLVPPPMCSLEVELEKSVNHVGFLKIPNKDFDSNCFFTMDFGNRIKLYRCILEVAINGRRLVSTEIAKEFQMGGEMFIHPIWISHEHFVIVKHSAIFLCSVDSGEIIDEVFLEESIGSLVTSTKENHLVAQLIDGSLIELNIENNELKMSNVVLEKLPEFCEKIIATTSKHEPAIYALKNLKKKLYLNSKELATEVTSLTITTDNDYLIFTTIAELKFVEIEGRSPLQIVETRRIERGSKIVSLIKDKSQIIFELPRGNLETISPRILSFKIVRRLLKLQKYQYAFDLLRKERINLNLLIDLNPQKFLKELELFIAQIDNIQWLNLFLTELRNEDVTQTMYKFCGKPDFEEEIFDGTFLTATKIEQLCHKMLEIFQKTDARKYLLPSITCHVKTQQIELALQMIWELKQTGTGDREADDAVKYLLYLIDINVLYDIALGMYDYQLVLFVAQKSQKDPKEYVPFLNELNKLDLSYSKYKIDCHLKRFAKAVGHIAGLCHSDDEKFEECVELVKKHNLYDSALASFSGHQKCYKRICVLYGDYLRVKGKLLDASLMYERGGEYQQALAGARNILDWQRCLVLAKKCGSSEEEMKSLAMKLVSSLEDVGHYKEAAYLLKRFNPDDFRNLVKTLTKGHFYSEAIVEVALCECAELIEEIIKPQLKIHLGDAIKSIDDDCKTFLQQKERLLSVRQEKTRKLLNPQDEYDDDIFSDTTSVLSASTISQSSKNTAKTFKSSKNRRKHERKLMNLKEGNKFEDIALLDSIWKLVQKIIAIESQNVVRELLKCAIEMSFDDDARTLQKGFKDLLLTIKYSSDEIWTPEMMSAGKYPETEEEMQNYNLQSMDKMSYDLISKFPSFLLIALALYFKFYVHRTRATIQAKAKCHRFRDGTFPRIIKEIESIVNYSQISI